MNATPSTLTALAERLELWPIDRLRPYERNPRTHSADQVAQIAASMVEFGFTNPILVDEADGILAGHGRLMAARELGLAEVPVVRLGHLTPAQKRAYVIADNQLALRAGWNDDPARRGAGLAPGRDLRPRSARLRRRRAGAAAGTGRGRHQRGRGRGAGAAGGADLASRAISGCSGDHRVLCGDATVLTDVERVLGGSLADMAWTDPPYNVDYGNSAKDKLRGKDRRILNDALGDGFGAFLQDACTNLLTVTKGAVYIAMSSSELHTLQAAFTRCRRQVVDLHHLGEEHLHPRPRRLPAAVRADPLRLAGRAPSTTGAAPATRATSGSSTSR